MIRYASQFRFHKYVANFARVVCALLVLTVFSSAHASVSAQTRATQKTPAPGRESDVARYQIDLKIDFERRRFEGVERVTWRNRAERQTSVLYFHLYANLRAEDRADGRDTESRRQTAAQTRPPVRKPGAAEMPAASDTLANDQNPSLDPSITILEVRDATATAPLQFALDETATLLRVNLRKNVSPGESATVEIKFRGSVPEITPDETSLTAHLLQQVGAATRDTTEWRAGRDTNFLCRDTMLLGAAFPLLAVRDREGDWQRRVERSIGDVMFAEAADYAVTVETAQGVDVFTSAPETSTPAQADRKIESERVIESVRTTRANQASDTDASRRHHFAGANLRLFALVAGRGLRVEERAVAGLSVRSVFTPEHERTGRRALQIAADAARVFSERFGASPYQQITIVETPLVAGLGAYEFSALNSIASAYYIDFDQPAMRLLPDIIREQRQSVEDSFEWTVAHTVAQQWWGGAGAVGSDPERAPFLDEALAHWSALYYFRHAHGEARAKEAADDQLRGVYEIYRTFGGDDQAADRPARDYRNSFQYAAIVSTKGALMYEALRAKLGDERFMRALRNYYAANRLLIAERDDMEAAFVAESAPVERRSVTGLFDRWLTGKRGDEDIAPPNQQLAEAVGVSSALLSPSSGAANDAKASERERRNRFVRLGKFFWRRMTRIR